MMAMDELAVVGEKCWTDQGVGNAGHQTVEVAESLEMLELQGTLVINWVSCARVRELFCQQYLRQLWFHLELNPEPQPAVALYSSSHWQ